MLRSCQYCGRIHDRKYICPQKQRNILERQEKRNEKNREAYQFRDTKTWREKSRQIRERDRYCCQVCIRGLHDPERQFETDGISVHHIASIREDWEKRLNNENLISLCRRHHEMAERGEIEKTELEKIAKEQERLDAPAI